MQENNIAPYNEQTRTGVVRHILIRCGFATGEVMVCLVINQKKLPVPEKLVKKLLELELNAQTGSDGQQDDICHNTDQQGNSCPDDVQQDEVQKINKAHDGSQHDKTGQDVSEQDGVLLGCMQMAPMHYSADNWHITSIMVNVNTENTNVILGTACTTLWGNSYIEDYIGDIKYRISPLSFYQVNPRQTVKLYQTALDFADLTGNETVWDLYCGIGTISLFLAKQAKKVYGVEIVPQAIEDARVNAGLNGIDNAEFFVGKAEEVLPDFYQKETARLGKKLTADVIVVDPPHKGCDESLLATMVHMEPKRIVYVSCDSATLSRDLKYLCGEGYKVERCIGCDMFAQGVHVETVVLLS